MGHRASISSQSVSIICDAATFQHVNKSVSRQAFLINTVLDTLFQHVETFRLPKRSLKLLAH